MEIIRQELSGLYGQSVLSDMSDSIKRYEFYEGEGQNWTVPDNMDYIPSKIKTNITKKLIDKQASFMFGRTPEFILNAIDEANDEQILQLQNYIEQVLKDNNFSKKLINASKDSFIGKRIAIKLYASKEEGIKVIFKPSLEFIYETEDDDVDKLTKIIFFYQMNESEEKSNQRIWKQKFEMLDGKCILNESIHDGNGVLVETIEYNKDTGIDFIPAFVVVNGGLSGDLLGESDISDDMMANQNAYNHLKSDDMDALRFNMFPQKVFKNCSQKTFDNLRIAPNAIIDAQTDASVESSKSAEVSNLESNFTYNERLENSTNRIKNDMYELLDIPNVSLEQLKGLMQSGKSMKALYWGLIGRCEEKWTTWTPALEWLIDTIIKLSTHYDIAKLPKVDYTLNIEHLYPILEDEESERINDLQEVMSQVRSRRSYIAKWGISEDADLEMNRIVEEQLMLQDQFQARLDEEIE